jgi:hypothetical protein
VTAVIGVAAVAVAAIAADHVHGQSVYGLLQRTGRLQRAIPIDHAVMIDFRLTSSKRERHFTGEGPCDSFGLDCLLPS